MSEGAHNANAAFVSMGGASPSFFQKLQIKCLRILRIFLLWKKVTIYPTLILAFLSKSSM